MRQASVPFDYLLVPARVEILEYLCVGEVFGPSESTLVSDHGIESDALRLLTADMTADRRDDGLVEVHPRERREPIDPTRR